MAQLAVDPGAHSQVFCVEFGFDPRTDRGRGVEPFGSGPLQVGFLQVAQGDVVGDGVAEHVLQSVFAADLFGHARNDDGQFGFVGHFFGYRGQADGFIRSDDGGVGDEEELRAGGNFVAEFPCVVGVVAADGDDFGARDDGRDQAHVRVGQAFAGGSGWAEEGVS